MKSVENICCKEAKILTFPRLMKGKVSGRIYLMTSRDLGIVIKAVNEYPNYPIGEEYRCSVNGFSNLEDYDGTVTLSND